MTSRGPLKTPGSVRALKEGYELAAPEKLTAPKWLKKRAKEIFDALVVDAISAGVPTRACDQHIFAMAAQATVDYQTAKDSAARARIGRDAEKFYAVIGAEPKARLQMGLKTKAPQKSETAKMLEMVKRVGEAPAGTP